MSFSTQSSTALGWVNFLYDYLDGVYPGSAFVDTQLDEALNTVQNGLSGMPVGGTIYFPPLSGSHQYQLSGTHTITGSCALISTSSQDTSFFFQPHPIGAVTTTGTALVIEGANVTLRGFGLQYPSPPGVNPMGGNLPAIQINSTSGVLIEDVLIQFAFGGVDCVASSVVCDRVEVDGIPNLSGISLTQLPYGFCAEPGDGGAPLDGLTMVLRDCHVEIDKHLSPSGIVAFMLIPPYPEMAIDTASPKQIHDGFRLMAGTSAVSGNSGILRVRNTSCEADARPVFVDGGSVAQISHLNDDETGRVGMTFSPNFSGVAALAGHHFGMGPTYAIEIGQSAAEPGGDGDEVPTSALVSVIDSISSSANIFVSLTASGSAVFNTIGLQQSGPSILFGAASAGPVAVVGSTPFTEVMHLSGSGTPPPVALEAVASNQAGDIGSGVTIENSPPFNPTGVVTPPSPSANPFTVTNESGADVVVYLRTDGTISITGISVNGVSTGLANHTGQYPVAVPANAELELHFSGTPTSTNTIWVWIAN